MFDTRPEKRHCAHHNSDSDEDIEHLTQKTSIFFCHSTILRPASKMGL